MSHLTCFVGGMYALGSKVFNRPGDLDHARRLTNGCVWAYNITATGVMPEHFSVRRCPSAPFRVDPRQVVISIPQRQTRCLKEKTKTY